MTTVFVRRAPAEALQWNRHNTSGSPCGNPYIGSWAWGSLYKGSGWLENLGFIDFAGSTVVHSIGGWAALAGAMVLGPRIGKYSEAGKPLSIPGHNIPLAALGVFILWFGWYGFNPGSTTTASPKIASIAVNITLVASAGGILAVVTAWLKYRKPDIGMTLNGALRAWWVSPPAART